MVYDKEVFFTIYINDFELASTGIGCHWSHHFGAVYYADDIALLAPSPSALHLMLDTCTYSATACDFKLVRYSMLH